MENYRKMITILFMVAIYLPVDSQILHPNNDLRKTLNKYLHDIGATKNISYDEVNLHIWDLLSNEKIITDSEMDKIGIYGFESVGSGQHSYILLKHNDDYEVFKITAGKYNEPRDYSAILDDLQAYFVKYPDLDYRLMPLYNNAIYEIYDSNTQQDELGPWFDWHETDKNIYLE